MAEIGVVYLVWTPLGMEPLERFLASYAANPGGVEHALIMVFNGYREREELAPFKTRLQNIPHTPLILDTPGQDIASYRQAAQASEHRYLCFLNSYCEFCDPAWLRKLHVNLTREGVGVVGATGSWETRVAPLAAERARLAQRGLAGRWRGQLRLAYQIARFPAFPNPHIRTNGFMLARTLLLELKGMMPRTKEQAYEFENRRYSMTRQITARGLRPLVVGRDGTGYEVADWPRSHTFRLGDQANLLITDNRTREFAASVGAARQALAERAWQEHVPIFNEVAMSDPLPASHLPASDVPASRGEM